MECLFCKIANHQQEAEIVFENKELIVFKDVNPKAPIHLLIVPKKHISSINELSDQDQGLISQMIFTAKQLAEEKGIAQKGYRLVFNVGREGGQLIDHLHLHLLGGAKLAE